jgi:hypothetical protein
MLRKLLVSGAHYILGPFGSDSDLRRHGEKIASRGGKNSKKRAVVTVARKLSVLQHSRCYCTACGLRESSTLRCVTPPALLEARRPKGRSEAEEEQSRR